MPSSCPQISLWLLCLPYILLLVFFAALFLWFSRRKNSFKKSQKSENPKANSNDTTEPGPPLGYPIRVIVDRLPPSPPPTEEEIAQKEHAEIREERKFFAEIAAASLAFCIVVITGIYTTYTYKMWCEMQAQTAQQAQQFASAQRPWLGIDGRPILTKPIEIQAVNGQKTAQIQTVSYVKNFGSQVAQHIGFDARIFVPIKSKGSPDYFVQEQMLADVACKMADLSTDKGRGPYLFPNNTNFEMITGSVPEDAFTEELKILGCISYWDEVSKKTHHTRFCVHSRAAIPQNTPATVLVACEENQYAD